MNKSIFFSYKIFVDFITVLRKEPIKQGTYKITVYPDGVCIGTCKELPDIEFKAGNKSGALAGINKIYMTHKYGEEYTKTLKNEKEKNGE